MPALSFKNVWGAQGSNVDQIRSDLFVLTLRFPAILNVGGGVAGANLWESECSFAIEQFPFPDRAREMIPIKFMNQTNYMIGADSPSQPTNIVVRQAFNTRTAELLERWSWLTSNPRTGGVALTSAVKTTGQFYWLKPNMERQAQVDAVTAADTMVLSSSYFLEGCLVQNLKPSDANMTQSGGVSLQFGLSIDRYYPGRPSDLTAAQIIAFAGLG